MINVICPTCVSELEFEPSLIGRKLMCGECGTKFCVYPAFPEKMQLLSGNTVSEVSGKDIVNLITAEKLDLTSENLALPGESEFFSYNSAIAKIGYAYQVVSVPENKTSAAVDVDVQPDNAITDVEAEIQEFNPNDANCMVLIDKAAAGDAEAMFKIGKLLHQNGNPDNITYSAYYLLQMAAVSGSQAAANYCAEAGIKSVSEEPDLFNLVHRGGGGDVAVLNVFAEQAMACDDALGADIFTKMVNKCNNAGGRLDAGASLQNSSSDNGSSQGSQADDYYNSAAEIPSEKSFGSALFSTILGIIAIIVFCLGIFIGGDVVNEKERTWEYIVSWAIVISFIGSFLWMQLTLFVLDPIRNSKGLQGVNLRLISEPKKIILALLLISLFGINFLTNLFWKDTYMILVSYLIIFVWVFMCFLSPNTMNEKTGLKRLWKFLKWCLKMLFGKLLGKGFLHALDTGSREEYVEVTRWSDGSETREVKNDTGLFVFLLFLGIICVVAFLAFYVVIIALALYSFFCFCRNYIFYR